MHRRISDTKGKHRKRPVLMGGRDLGAGRERGMPVARKQDYLGALGSSAEREGGMGQWERRVRTK